MLTDNVCDGYALTFPGDAVHSLPCSPFLSPPRSLFPMVSRNLGLFQLHVHRAGWHEAGRVSAAIHRFILFLRRILWHPIYCNPSLLRQISTF